MYSMEQFEKVCIGYYTRLNYAKFLCDIHKSYYLDKDKYIEKLKIAPNFFDASFKTILSQAMLITANFYVHGKTKEFTIHKILKIMETDSFLRRTGDTEKLDKVINEGRDFMEEKQDSIKRLIEWRHSYIAHNDKKYFVDRHKIDPTAKINIKELIELLSYGLDMIRKVGKILELELKLDESRYVNDFPVLLEHIIEKEEN